MLGKRICIFIAAVIILSAVPAVAATKAAAPAPMGVKLPLVVATINGEKITKDDLMRTTIDWDAPMVLEQMIMYRVVSQEARKAGVVVTAEQIKAKFDEMKKNLPPGQGLDELLKRSGMTASHAFGYMKMNLQVEGIVRKEIKVSPDDLAGFTKASHILIRIAATTDPKEKEKNEADAKAKIDKIAEEIKAGLAFDEAAKKYSEDPMSKEKGGDLDFFGKGQMVPEFEKAVEGLKPGEVSQPVKTSYGYHIIKFMMNGKDSKGDDRKKIEDQVTQRMMGDKWREFMLTARNRAKIVNFVEPIKPEPNPVAQPRPPAPRPRTEQQPAPGQETPPPPPGVSDAEAATGAAPPPPPAEVPAPQSQPK